MKVCIAITLDVDPDAWRDAYGVPVSEVRSDVREWAFHTLVALADGNGVLRRQQ